MKYLFCLVIISSSCNNHIEESTTKEVGDFSLRLPNNLKYEKFNSIDTQSGRFFNDSISIFFDYGYLAINEDAAKTEKDYILKKKWLVDAVTHIMPVGVKYSSDSVYKAIKVLSFDISNHMSYVIYKNKTYKYKIQIPKHLEGRYDKIFVEKSLSKRVIYSHSSDSKKNNYEFHIIEKIANGNPNSNKILLKAELNNISDTMILFKIFDSIKLKI